MINLILYFTVLFTTTFHSESQLIRQESGSVMRQLETDVVFDGHSACSFDFCYRIVEMEATMRNNGRIAYYTYTTTHNVIIRYENRIVCQWPSGNIIVYYQHQIHDNQ